MTQCEALRRDGSRCPHKATRHLDAGVSERHRITPAPEPRTVSLCGQHRNALEKGVRSMPLAGEAGMLANVYLDRDGRAFWDVYPERV